MQFQVCLLLMVKQLLILDKKTDYLKLSKYFIILYHLLHFVIASKGFDILYLFLLADLFCCAFVLHSFL